MDALLIFFIVLLITIVVIVIYAQWDYHQRVDESGAQMNTYLTKINHLKPKKNMIDIPVLYINLERSKDRREYMEAQIQKYGVDGERVDAVDGNKLIGDQQAAEGDGKAFPWNALVGDQQADLNEVNYTSAFSLSPSELGCTLSHIKAARRVWERKLPYALIVEDDCFFGLAPLWKESLTSVIAGAPADWEILQLFSMQVNDSRSCAHWKPWQGEPYAVAYIINRKGAANVLRRLKYRNTEDCIVLDSALATHGVADVLLYSLCKTYTITPSLFVPDNSSFNSTLHDSHTYTHVTQANAVLEHYLTSRT